MYLQAGTLLRGDTYKIIRFIAAGGFGCTYEAVHVALKKRVAIKEFFVSDFCNRDYTGQVSVATDSKRDFVAKLKRKFYDEACAVASLKHPGIVSVNDVFEEKGTAYFVMDYIDGRSLADIVRAEGALPEARALGYIRQVCAALHYVHANNRLHLDIKPQNIMVDGADRAILIDFGVSKQYDEETGENTSTLLGHTPGYAPPEQAIGKLKKFLPATDIYALGATLYHLLTGTTPPASGDISSGEADLQPLPAYISAATRKAVSAAMQIRKNDRPQSVSAFAALLGGGASPGPSYVNNNRREQMLGQTIPEYHGVQEPTMYDPSLPIVKTLFDPNAGHVFEPTKAAIDPYNGHDWVDLGLSVKWAKCNVGAYTPTGYGDFYAWGEISTKNDYTEDSSLLNGKQIGSICANSSLDVARAEWGSPWRLPTALEIKELIDNCTWEWTTINKTRGYKVTSNRNGNWIFLPAAGWIVASSLSGRDSMGNYWSGTPHENGCSDAYKLYFYSGKYFRVWDLRYEGFSIRPVAD